MSKHAAPTLVLFLASAAALPAQADAIEVTLTSVKDNTLFEDETGSLSNGAGTRMFAGETLQPGHRRALVAFDLSELPEDAVITDVTLTLDQVMTISGAQDVTLHRVLQDWGEGDSVAGSGQGIGAPPAPGDATWLHTFFDTDFWDTPGGDYALTPSATATIDGFGLFDWSSDAMIDDVQDWVYDPASNFGWVLIGNEALPGSAKTFSTREASAGRPTLFIEYMPQTGCDGGEPVPASSSWGTLALALVLMTLATLALRHRRMRVRADRG